jgi:hypothetical protein
VGTNTSEVISLASSSPALSLPTPPRTYVGPGQATTGFGALLAAVQQTTAATVTATLFGQPFVWSATIVPTGPGFLDIDPPELVGGVSQAIGTIYLNAPADPGGTSVAVASDSPAAVAPGHVLIPEGADSVVFPISTSLVTNTVTATVTASRYDQVQTNTLVIRPIGPDLITFSQTNVIGGKRTAVGTVHLNAPAEPGGALVRLALNEPAAQIPDQVLVPEGARSADFVISTVRVTNDAPVVITASRYDLTVANTLNVIPIPTIVLTHDLTLAATDLTTLEEMNVVVASNATLTVVGTHQFTSLSVAGTVTHQPGDTNGLRFIIDELMDVQPGGALDVSSNGFTGGNPYRGWNCETRGADGRATTVGASTGTSGGSYGSLGASPDGTANGLYGLETAPVDLGSGGSFDGGWNYGGNGGGRVDIEAGQLIVNGSILANGGYGSWGGGGSGGSIWLRIAGGDFQGSGLIQAQGGSPYGGGAGGGGRIAITAHAATNFTGTVSAGNGTICWQLEALPNPHLSLTIARIDVHTLLLGWPASPAGFILQQNPDLGPAHWTDVLAQPVDNGTNKQVILDAPSGTLFFRLRR